MNEWTQIFWYVAAARRNGEAPTLEKAVGNMLFIAKEDADSFQKTLERSSTYAYRVFEATATIQREQPLT